MILAATDDQPPLPRRSSPRIDPIKMRGKLPLCVRWSERFFLPTGQLATITHVWLTASLWKRFQKINGSGWQSRTIGFIVIAYRIES